MSPRAKPIPIESEVALMVVTPDAVRLLRRISELRRINEFTVELRRDERFRDTYLDTPDGRLAARDYVLRIRDFGGGAPEQLTLKTPHRGGRGLVSRRGELDATSEPGLRHLLRALEPLPGGAAARPAQRRSAAHAALAEGFVTVQTRDNRRTCLDVSRDGKRVAELAIDRVRYRPGGRVVGIEELEVEAKDSGTAADVEAIARALVWHFGPALRPWRASKLAIGKVLERWAARGQLAARLTSRRTIAPRWFGELARAAARR